MKRVIKLPKQPFTTTHVLHLNKMGYTRAEYAYVDRWLEEHGWELKRRKTVWSRRNTAATL